MLPWHLTWFLVTILFYHVFSFFFFFFLIVDLHFLISAVIVQISILNTELLLSIGIPRKEAKAEIEIHPVTTDIATRKCSV